MTVKLGYTPTIASDKNLNDAQVDGNYFLSELMQTHQYQDR